MTLQRRSKRSRRLRGALLTTLLAAPLTLLPAGSGVAASGGEGGWNKPGCTSERERPVVLVHGTGGNAWLSWFGLAPYLVERGYCVYSLNYGQMSGVPILHGLAPIEGSADQLADFVDGVLATTGADEVDIVGHSQGGMMPRYYLKHHPEGEEQVNALIALAPSTNGTTASGLIALLDLVPGLSDFLNEHSPVFVQQATGSRFITELNEGGYTLPGVDYTVIGTNRDHVITPYDTQFIDEPGVTNVLLQDLCPENESGHMALALSDEMAFHEVANALDPASAEPTGCELLPE
ncbi:alpha/beta fold hydrolase [Streptomyces sp. NBRC 109706]|uniref:lipase family alpha/beta hydrolase n=1 Tax=Streptomyces sp. NBRC 109706 TaxID=1550035 RepID=UPI000783B5E6|nr:alpha/beta fold hydrolase [Streptomyces sp. NBRC 109706]